MIPRQWEGEIVVCAASGPSLTKEDLSFFRGKSRVIAVNESWRLAPWCDALYCCDFRFIDHHKGISEYTGQKWTIDKRAKEKYQDWNKIEGKNQEGFSLSPERIHNGRNGGFQALNLALLFGARAIILLGYDMQTTGGRSHWHGDHPAGLTRTQGFQNFISAFDTVRPQLATLGVPIINCTRETALKTFARMSLEEAFDASREKGDPPDTAFCMESSHC